MNATVWITEKGNTDKSASWASCYMSWDQALNSRMSFTLFSFSVILPSYSCPIFPFVDSDVTNTNSTETGSSSANKFCPTPNLLNMEVSSRRVCMDAKLHGKKVWSCAVCYLYLAVCCAIVSLQRPWRWRAWPWTVWGRRRRPTTWWEEGCAMTSRATSVSLLMAWHTSFVEDICPGLSCCHRRHSAGVYIS